MKYQVTLGAGAPSAWQLMVASFPSSAVRLAGGKHRVKHYEVGNKGLNNGTDAAQGNIITGTDAAQGNIR